MQTAIVVDEFFLFYLKSIVKTLFDHFLSQKKLCSTIPIQGANYHC